MRSSTSFGSSSRVPSVDPSSTISTSRTHGEASTRSTTVSMVGRSL